jgi:surface polysaccharide O-acyltransferase-like enzyme
MGLGVAMAALSNHSTLKNKMLSKIGQMTLGIYAVHFIFVDLLRPIDKVSDDIVWEVGYVVVVLALSILTSLALSKNKITKKIVV